ncbi:hypothetical protein CR513_47460, partial [Mucuna pruriens]
PRRSRPITRKLSRDEVVPARLTPSWSGQASQSSSPMRSGPKVYPPQLQIRGHLSSSSAATLLLEKLVAQVTQGGGGPSPSTMAIVMEDGVTVSRPCSGTKSVRLYSIRLNLTKTLLDKDLPSPYRTSLYRERVGTLHSKYDIKMLLSNLGASINVMPMSIYKALNFGRKIRTRINLNSRETIPDDIQNKIDVHARTLLMEFGDTLVQFNIFEVMKHPIEDHSLFGIDLTNELAEEYFQLDSHSEDINNFAEKTDSIGCLRSISKEEADHVESRKVHNLSDSVDNNNDIADLDFEAKLLEVLDQVCKHENSECFTKVEVQVAGNKKLLSAQLATIFMVEDESAKGSRDRERTKVISAKKTTVKVNLHVQTHAKTISAKEDQKQAEAKFISNVQGEDSIPSRSNSRIERRVESDFHLTRTKSRRRSQPQQPKAEIMSAHLVSSSTQVDQPDSKASHDNSSSLPPPMELKPLPKYLKYAYLDTQQHLLVIIANNLHQEQEDKLLQVLRQHKRQLGGNSLNSLE